MRHTPKLSYCGLTIILSNPSRFDTSELISANAGRYFNDECLRPDVNRWMCDIRTKDDHSPFIQGTKGVLLLGTSAMESWTSSKHSLNEQRGCPIIGGVQGIPAIASYLPQDACDMQNYEAQYNQHLEDEEEDEKEKEDESGKRHGRTDRRNFRFWLKQDTKKILEIIREDGASSQQSFLPNYQLYPSSDTLVSILTETKGKSLYIDIETDTELNMRCFSFNLSDSDDVYIVPTLDVNYAPAYGSLPKIMQALMVAFRDNEVVAHNGAAFDFLVFAMKYRIGIGKRVYDTMIAHHRCFPNVEKSLGHCVSLWTHEPYHKDEGNFSYRSQAQAEQLWKYCGKDVYTMRLVREGIDKYANRVSGLPESIAQANASIRPYLIMTLTGIRYNLDLLQERVAENDKLMEQYLRVMKILTGPDVPPLISNQKCVQYFHNMLGYDVVSRSKKTKAPSLAEKNLLKLRLKYENPVIDLLLKYRQVQKETGALKFIPWKS